MNASQGFIAIAIVSLAVIFVILLIRGKGVPKGGKLSPLAYLAFAFVVAGIIFGQNRIVGYSLIGIGVILAFIDMFKSMRQKKL
jgi:hypothetical protein